MTKKTKPKGLEGFDPTIQRATSLKNQQTTTGSVPAEDEKAAYIPKSVNLRKSDWRLLRLVARVRADNDGGRDSVSKVVESLIDANRKALEAESKES